jgi:hypothetical protein
MHDNRVQVDRVWVWRFVQRNSETLTLQRARLLEKDRHKISEDDLNHYFDAVTIQLQNIPSPFVWNADETRVRISKKPVAPGSLLQNKLRQGLSQSLKNTMVAK